MITTVPANVAAGRGGVAFMAHIGGFIAGAALVRLFAAGGGRRTRVA